jgi:hypothetical protein
MSVSPISPSAVIVVPEMVCAKATVQAHQTSAALY